LDLPATLCGKGWDLRTAQDIGKTEVMCFMVGEMICDCRNPDCDGEFSENQNLIEEMATEYGRNKSEHSS
jgi:hypothetical protein